MEPSCRLCPRRCGVNRAFSVGFCRAPALPRVAKVMLHPWEEPCICRGKGAGAVFFSGCALRCVFCQNHEISQKMCGEEMDETALTQLFFSLEEQGASCLDLVSPTPYLETLIPVLQAIRERGFSLPVVYNTGGYESVESLKRLDGLVDVYLPDLKYFDPAAAKRYSGAEDYFPVAQKALEEMARQTGKPVWDGECLTKGVLIRHLVLPGLWRDSIRLLEEIEARFGKDGAVLSLMRQYTPCYRAKEFPEINRRLTSLEYEKVCRRAEEAGFPWVYTQEKESASTDFIPDFL